MGNNITTGWGNNTVVFALTPTWTLGSALITLDQNFSTKFTGWETSKDLVIQPTHQIFDKTLTGIFDTYISEKSTAKQELFENGQNASSAVSASTDPSNSYVGVLTIGGPTDETTPTRFVRFCVAQMSGGAFTTTGKTTTRPDTIFTAIGVPESVQITATQIEAVASNLISGASTLIIGPNDYGVHGWFTSVGD